MCAAVAGRPPERGVARAAAARLMPPDAGSPFDQWKDTSDYPTLFVTDRPVLVDSRVFPSAGAARRQDELALWIRGEGLRLDPWMAGRQIAWIRLNTGAWLASVQIPAASANRRCRITLQLWLEPDAFTTDMAAGR